MSELQAVLDRYNRALARERDQTSEPSGPTESFTETVRDVVVDFIAAKSSILESGDDIRSLFGEQLRQVGSSSTVAGPVDEADASLRGALGAGADLAIRVLAASSIGRAAGAGIDLVFLIQAEAQEIKDLVADIQETFGVFTSSRSAFEKTASTIQSAVVPKSAQIQADAAALFVAAKGLGSFTGLRSRLTTLCAALDDLIDTILAPNTVTNRIYVLLQRLEERLLRIIDLLIEMIDVIDGVFEIRSNVSEVPVPYDVVLNYVDQLSEIVRDFVDGSGDLDEQSKYRRVDAVRRYALELQALSSVICNATIDGAQALEFSAYGALLNALETALAPLKQQLDDATSALRKDTKIWLLTLRNHVQKDVGVGFDNTTAEILSALDTILNLMALISAAFGPSRVSAPEVGEKAIEAAERAGLAGTGSEFRQGRFTKSRSLSVETATAAGELANCLRQELDRLRTEGTLAPGQEARLEAVISFLNDQHRGSIQSSAIQQTRATEGASGEDRKAVASAIAVEEVRKLLPEEE